MKKQFLLKIGLAAALIESLANATSFFLPLYFSIKLHFSVPVIGSAITLLGIGTLVGSMCATVLCKFFTEYTLQIISFGLMFICLFLFAITCNIILVNLAAFFFGMGMFLFHPINQVWILNLIEKNKPVHVNNVRLMILNAGVGAALIIYGFLSHHNFTLVYYLAAILTLSMFITLLCFTRCVPKKVESEQFEENKASDKISSKFRIALLLIYISLLVVGLIYAQLRSTYPIYMHQFFHLEARGYGLLFSLNTFLIVILQIPLVSFASKYNQRLSISLGAFLIGGGMVVMTFSSHIVYAIVSCVIWTLGEMLFFSLIQVTIFNHVHEKRKVFHMSFYQFIYAMGIILGPVGGSLVYHYLYPNILWWICGFLGIIAALMSYFSLRSDYTKRGKLVE